jgi:hypothetical protein
VPILRRKLAMKMPMVFFTAFFLSSCAHFVDSKEKPQLYEERFAGEHSALANCVTDKLRTDSRSFMRVLLFRNRKYSDVEASEIHAFDTRYLRNIVATYSPTNPDAVLIYSRPITEILPYARREDNNEPVYVFALMLKKIDDAVVDATLKGDQYLGGIAWKILQTCMTSTTNHS